MTTGARRSRVVKISNSTRELGNKFKQNFCSPALQTPGDRHSLSRDEGEDRVKESSTDRNKPWEMTGWLMCTDGLAFRGGVLTQERGDGAGFGDLLGEGALHVFDGRVSSGVQQELHDVGELTC